MDLSDVLNHLDTTWPRGDKLHCPAHEDHTPSLHLYADTDSFYCFSCGANGDAYGLMALLTGVPVEDVLKQYGGGLSGKSDRPLVSQREMFESVIADWQDYQPVFWLGYHDLIRDTEGRLNFIDYATSLPDMMWGGPLTMQSIPEGITPAALQRQVNDAKAWYQHCYETVHTYLNVKLSDGILRRPLQPTLSPTRRSSRDSIRDGTAARPIDQVRVEQARGIDEQDGQHAQALARLLRRGRLPRGGSRVRS